jgi:sigma-E factor negative regulatory protein RseA
VTQEQVESQLSAMFDGELPAAECELLSRRIDRDENLRARWSRYALIGAAMRSEPVATARRGFAARVSAALETGAHSGHIRLRASSVQRKRTLWNTALAASMVVAVAGVSISTLRYSAPASGNRMMTRVVLRPVEPGLVVAPAVATTTAANAPGLLAVDMRAPTPRNGEPRSYVTPLNQPVTNANMSLRTELADYIVAHSEYSTPLMRRSLLSTLVSSEDAAEAAAVNGIQNTSAPAASATGR